jgi:ferredoxin--NADP+ reductase
MFRVIHKQVVVKNIKRMDILAEGIARCVKPGQFVMVRPQEKDEAIPLSVVEADSYKGTITVIFQEIGVTTGRLGALPINDTIYAVIGPLGRPAPINKVGQVICAATGISTAQALPVCRELRRAGNKVIGVIGAKNKRAIVLEPQMRLTCHKVFIATQDGSFERRGFATDVVKDLLAEESIQQVFAFGSTAMMEDICRFAAERSVASFIHLNPLMYCGIGRCGSCRVYLKDQQQVLACVDGPIFPGQMVDFTLWKNRMLAWKEQTARLKEDEPFIWDIQPFKRWMSETFR